MEVYIEYVIITNLLADWFILKCAFSLSGEKYGKGVIIATLIATAFGVAYLLFDTTKYELLIKTIASFVIVKSANVKGSIHTFLKDVLCFYVISFVFGGLVYFLDISLEGLSQNGIIVIVAAGGLFVTYAVRQIKRIIVYDKNCEYIELNKNKIKCLLDTGNSLDYHGNPVSVIDWKYINKIKYQTEVDPIVLNTVLGSEERNVFFTSDVVIKGRKLDKFYFVFGNIKGEYGIILNREYGGNNGL